MTVAKSLISEFLDEFVPRRLEMKEMCVSTQMGDIVVYPNINPDYPGITVMYKPNESSLLIDLVSIEGCEEETSSGVNDKTLNIYLYDNVWEEDYQLKSTIKYSDVHDMLVEYGEVQEKC